MSIYEWLSIAGSIVISSGSILAYLMRKIEKLEMRVSDAAIMSARLEERLGAIDRKLDLLIAAYNSAALTQGKL